MKKTKLAQIACVIFLAVFIVLLVNGNAKSDKTAGEVFEKVSQAVDMTVISECSKSKFKKETGFDISDFESAVYYAGDTNMEVREVLIIKLADDLQADATVAALRTRADEKAKLFKGYAPEQSAQLEKYILEKRAGFVFFAVCDDPAAALAAFKNAL